MATEEAAELADDYLRVAVARGGRDWPDIVDDGVEYLRGHGGPEQMRALLTGLAGRHFAAHLEAQTSWPDRTDNDRLTDAFRALDASGLIAREDFACCQSCGVGEIGGEAIETAPARGYVFYHYQDAERAVDCDGLRLAFGLIDEPPTAAIGREIVAALRAEGLPVDWNDAPGERITVPMRWARRRHGRMAAHPSGPGARQIGVEVVRGEHEVATLIADTVLEEIVLPWLPDGVAIRLTDGDRAIVVHREFDRLVSDEGHRTGRFDGLRLFGTPGEPQPEEDLLEVTYESQPNGPYEDDGRPMTAAEAVDVLRRLPTRTESWLCAAGRSGDIVQMCWEDGRLWLETPDDEVEESLGKFATLAEAERMLTVLADEDRVAIRELPEVLVRSWDGPPDAG